MGVLAAVLFASLTVAAHAALRAGAAGRFDAVPPSPSAGRL